MQARKASEQEGVGGWELGKGSWSVTWRSSKDLSVFPTLCSAKGLVSNHYFLSPVLLHLSNAVSFKSTAFLPSLLPWKQLPLPSQEGFIDFSTFFPPLFKKNNYRVKILPSEKSSLKKLEHLQMCIFAHFLFSNETNSHLFWFVHCFLSL